MGRKDITVTITAKDLASNVFAQARGEVLKYAAGFASGQAAIDLFYRAVDIGKAVIVDSVKAFAEAEQVTARLSASFKSLGVDQVSATASASKLATQLSQQSGFTDEAIISAQELLVSIGKLSGDGLDRATRASVDLATKLGIDVTDAAKLLAKAAVGATETLARYGIVVDKTGSDSEVFARVLQQVETQFGGIARAASDTLSGSMNQASKAVDELKESFGGLIASGGVRESLQAFTTAINQVKSALDDADSSTSRWVERIKTINNATPIGSVLNNWKQSLLALGAGDKIIDEMQTAFRALNTTVEKTPDPLKQFYEAVDKGADALKKQREEAEKANEFLKKYMETVAMNARLGISRQELPFVGDKSKIPLDQGTLFDLGLVDAPTAKTQPIKFGEGGDSSVFDPQTGTDMQNAGQRFDDSIKSAAESMMTIQDAGRELAYGIFATLSQNVYALFTGAQSFGETIRAIFQDILQMVIKIVIQLAVATALKAAFGVALVNQGGVIHAAAGMVGGADISADVVPALLTPGEVVLSRSEAERYMSAPAQRGGGQSGHINANVMMPTKLFREWVRYQNDWVRRRGGTFATQGAI